MKTRTMAEMVRHQDPLAMPPGATVQEACIAMHRRRVGAVLVVEHGKLAGIFTGRDAVLCLAREMDPARTALGQVMTKSPTTLRAQDRAIEALRLMNDGGFRHLPVVEEGRVLGIVSRYDFRTEEHGRMDEETGYFEVIR
ncbi:CBS domain-containing protein [Roseococcus thiosulfatophilus]|uniref:CBS domain-containing protein n=1 Tax=Roseococcus thiosulfatophilus TaxID=35813 RepID=UPI001A8F0B16|nr:CBS domain-containing protein [Roseococcus thiosulfatophilus]